MRHADLHNPGPGPTVAAEKPIAATLEDELLAVLARQAVRVPIPVLLLAGIIAATAAQYFSVPYWGSWMATVAIMQLVRMIVLTRLPGLTNHSLQARLRVATALSFVNGAVLAASLYAFPVMTELEQAIQTMLLAGLAAGTVVSSAGYRPIFLAFLLPIFVPMFALWATNAGQGGADWEKLSVAALVVMFAVLLFAVASDSFKLFRESFTIRLHQMKLNEQLRRALNEADAANKAKTRFLAAASHDLRQPLHTLSLYGAALMNRPLDERTRDIAQHMNVALDALGTQLDALLDISRLDAGVVTAVFENVDLQPLLEQVVSEFEPSAAEKSLTLALHCPSTAAVNTDKTLLHRVLVNLVSNAIKYTDNGGIVLRATPGEKVVNICVADTGMGIAPDQQRRVFDEFYQVGNPHRDRSQGFGLGLSIVQRMTHLLGIEISMESELGNGTSFYLSVPAADASPAEADDDLDLRSASLEGLRVLAVDDEREILLGLSTLLQSLGCEVRCAESTSEAAAEAGRWRPDVLICDFRLRDGDDGLTALAAVREQHPGLPALMVSGDTAPDRLREAQAAGIALLHKPVRGEELHAAIAHACGRSPQRDVASHG